MRILLVTWTDQLAAKLQILNPGLECCGIVVDEVEPAKKILEKIGLPNELLHPMYDLKECVRDFYYDYILCLENNVWVTDLMDNVKDYIESKDKIINFCSLNSTGSFLVEHSLRYFKEHITEFEMFATGISYTEFGLDATRFKHKLYNFGYSGQDLYYNFQTAKFAISCGGGIGRLRYALIGLAPYSFHYDHSKTPHSQFVLLQYFIAFEDLHNFHVPVEDYKAIFRKEYLSAKLQFESFDGNRPFYSNFSLRFMTPKNRLDARKVIDAWSKKSYPETRDENIKILDDYLTLCEENHIRPIMFLPPMTEGYMKHFSRQKLDEFYYLVREACRKHSSALFIDGWKLQGFTDADFYEVSHMNIQGAAKFSAYLNNFIEYLENQSS